MTRRTFSVIASRMREELDNITVLKAELEDKRVRAAGKDRFTLRAIGSIIHDFYVIAENVFRIVAKEIDEKPPKGEHWHRELLLQMTLAIPGVRPALLRQRSSGGPG